MFCHQIHILGRLSECIKICEFTAIKQLGKFELKDFQQKVMDAGITDETVLDLETKDVPDSPPLKAKKHSDAEDSECICTLNLFLSLSALQVICTVLQ